MNIAILGGGITGLTAAYSLAKKGHSVTLFEKSDTLGGLARGFKEKHWDWPLEKAYHHIFHSDKDIINFAEEIGYTDIYFEVPKTDSLYRNEDGSYSIVPVDSPIDFLRFPYLAMHEKIRAAYFLALLKFGPNFPLYEHMTAQEFVEKFMGKKVWKVFLEQLFRKKFGKYAENILASFLWARINKRTQKLGYMKKGFQSFIDHLENECKKAGVEINKGYTIQTLKKDKTSIYVDGRKFDKVVSTLPSPILAQVGKDIFPKSYIQQLTALSYLHARVLILETDKPIVSDTYWLNICAKDIPMMVLAQHTNFVDKKHYGGNHIAYIGYYLERDDEIMKLTEKQLVKKLMPYLKRIGNEPFNVQKTYDFKGPFAQPIFNETLLRNKPSFESPIENFYVANLDMTYPYDRGTNFAVKLGREVSEKVDA